MVKGCFKDPRLDHLFELFEVLPGSAVDVRELAGPAPLRGKDRLPTATSNPPHSFGNELVFLK